MNKMSYEYLPKYGPIRSVKIDAWKYPYKNFCQNKNINETDYAKYKELLYNKTPFESDNKAYLTELSAAFATSLLNNAENQSANGVISGLLNLYDVYQKKIPMLAARVPEWICDFCLINESPNVFFEICVSRIFNAFFANDYFIWDCVSSFLQGDIIAAEEKTTLALNGLCRNDYKSFSHRNSQTALYESAIRAVLPGVFRKAATENGKDFFIPPPKKVFRNAYSGLACKSEVLKTFEIVYLPFSECSELCLLTTESVKFTENLVRQGSGIKSKISGISLPADYRKLISDTLRERFPNFLPPLAKVGRKPKKNDSDVAKKNAENEKKSATAKKIADFSVDLKKAEKLESESWQITELLSGDYGNDEIAVSLCKTENADNSLKINLTDNTAKMSNKREINVPEEWKDFFATLSENEKAFLSCIAQNKNTVAFAKKIGGLPLGFADSINEKAAETYGDIVIDVQTEIPQFLDDYKSELCKIFGELNNTEVP